MSTSTSTSTSSSACKIDKDILNEKSLKQMDDIGLSFFASVCGKNRGAFVLDPPDGNTYGWYVNVDVCFVSLLRSPEFDSDSDSDSIQIQIHSCLCSSSLSYSFVSLPSFLLRPVFIQTHTNTNTHKQTNKHILKSLQLPANITDVVGISKDDQPDESVRLKLIDANSIKDQYVGGNITANVAIELLDFLVERSYESTPNKEKNPFGCDVNGLAKLSCPNGDGDGSKSKSIRSPRSDIDGKPIRSVTLVGLLIPDEPWPTTTTKKSTSSARIKYTTKDFKEMIDLGLNTVQISVPTSVFNPDDDSNGIELKSLLDSTLNDIQTVGHGKLKVILSLVSTGDELKSVVLGSVYASSKQNKDIVLGMTIPKDMIVDNKTIIDSIRSKVGPQLSIFIPYTEVDILSLSNNPKNNGGNNIGIDDPNVYGSLTWSHTTSVGDIASSSSQEDRSKMFYHESIACTMRSPIEHSACGGVNGDGGGMPIFWSSGFDLSIDNCIYMDSTSDDDFFKDYGQCERFDETIDSGWWKNHRISFASRQLYSAEQGLGWSFASWKLDSDDDDDDETKTTGVTSIDEPKQLVSLKDVVNAGLFPDLLLTTKTKTKTVVAQTACLNPPTNDFILGDATLSPTPMPPPDCGNGWWNATTTKCKLDRFLYFTFNFLICLILLKSVTNEFSNQYLFRF
jgi:hypothetical protein